MLQIKSSDTVTVTSEGNEGFDGHCYRMVHYWPHLFPGLDYDNLTPEDVNALKKAWDDQRSDSKPVSFALQYQGTWSTLVKNCGFSKEESQAIEANFHTLYAVSAAYTQQKLQEATKTGYVKLAYGLRLRTPVLKQTILNSKVTPREAQAEARTAGNALSGQSYGLINTKAGNEFMARVRADEKMRTLVRPAAHIHDAQYYLVRNNLETLKWVNDNMIECMVNRIEGQLPELVHPEVGLNAELDVYFPSWASALTLPNNISHDEIHDLAQDYLEKFRAA